MSERHSTHRRARSWDDGDPYDARDDPGSHEATNLRHAAAGPSPEELSRRLGSVYSLVCWCGEEHGEHGGQPHPWPRGPLDTPEPRPAAST